MEFMHLYDFLTKPADLSTMSNFHFLQKALFLKPSHFFSLHFFLLHMEAPIAYTEGKNLAYVWILTLEKAKLG